MSYLSPRSDRKSTRSFHDEASAGAAQRATAAQDADTPRDRSSSEPEGAAGLPGASKLPPIKGALPSLGVTAEEGTFLTEAVELSVSAAANEAAKKATLAKAALLYQQKRGKDDATNNKLAIAGSSVQAANRKGTGKRSELELQVPLRLTSPRWWNPPEPVLEAADSFDKQYRTLRGVAGKTLKELQADSTSLRLQSDFERTLKTLRGHRYVVQPLRAMGTKSPWCTPRPGCEQHPLELELASEQSGPWSAPDSEWAHLETGSAVPNRVRRKRRWNLDASIWGPRKASSNAKDYFETEAAWRKTFEFHWNETINSHGLENSIMKTQARLLPKELSDETRQELARQELDEVREGVWRHHIIIYSAFDYYAALFADNDADGEPDIFAVSYKGYLSFVRDVNVVDANCPARLLDLIFKQVNVDLDAKAAGGLHTLDRNEWLEVVVRVTLLKYVQSGLINDISDAIYEFCSGLGRALPAQIRLNSNLFRSRFCYVEQTDAALLKHEGSLVALYDVYSGFNETVSSLNSGRLMSLDELSTMIEQLGFIESEQISPFELRLVFTRSRMRCVCEGTARSQIRLRHLLYEDFLEAVVRIATTIALPTDAELEETGAKDAGAFLMMLRADTRAWSSFVASHRGGWDVEPRQPIGRLVDHLCCVFVGIVRANTRCSIDGETDGPLSHEEVARFMKRRMGARDLTTQHSEMAGQFLEKLEQVRQRALDALSRAEVFFGLSDEELIRLRDSMAEAAYEAGALICEQGEAADSFHVITEGEIEVLRHDPDHPDEGEQVINVLVRQSPAAAPRRAPSR